MFYDYPDNTHYLDSYKLRDENNQGFWPCIFPFEDNILNQTALFMDSLRLLSSVPTTIMLTRQSNNAVAALAQLENCRTQLIVDIAQIEFQESLKIYPNPAFEYVNMEFKNQGEKIIEIFNPEGQIIKSINTRDLTINIDISEMAIGLYIVRVINDNIIHVEKLIKH